MLGVRCFHNAKTKVRRITMLYERSALCVILGIFFVLSVSSPALSQVTLSESGVITVTEEINVAELNRNVRDLDASVKDLREDMKELSTNLKNLNNNITQFNAQFARLDERTQNNSRLLYVIIAGIFGIPIVQRAWSWWITRNTKNEEYTQSKPHLAFDNQVMEFNPSSFDSGSKSNSIEGKSQ